MRWAFLGWLGGRIWRGNGNTNGLAVVLWPLVTNTLFILFGCYLGRKIARKIRFNLSWVSGAILVAMAFMKVVPF